MMFFFDRCTSPRIARAIAALETTHTIRHHDDDGRFTTLTTDLEWIDALAADELSWAVVSGDARILRNKVERAALKEAALTFFCLTKAWMSMGFNEQAWKFVKVWPAIVESALHSKTKIFEVAGGKALKVYPLK